MTKITSRRQDQAKWYQDVIREAELADYGPVRGTIIFKPYGYAIWEMIQKGLDYRIKAAGVENVYFPLFIPYSFLQKEKKHVEGFSPELALVTHGGGKKLEEPLVVRPTSETIMYETFARWVQSYRDLPLKINQWANVVRWEKRTLPFIRGLEFLWQEGHTVHAREEEAKEEVLRALMMYRDFVKEELSLYAVAGYKTEVEKFAGAEYTTSIEVLLKDGKALQAGTSHMLGQNFAKSFDLKFLNEGNRLEYAWQTSWGLSTRIIGGVILAHGDDKGLRLPPRIAPIQVIIVPIIKSSNRTKVINYARRLEANIKEWGVRVRLDDGDKTAGFKFNYWEVKGVPIRIEVGEKEADKDEVVVYRRDKDVKQVSKLSKDGLLDLLDEIQLELFNEHKKFTQEHTWEVESFEEMQKVFETKRGFVKVWYKDDPQVEAYIKEATGGVTARCIPFESIDNKGKCFYSGKTGAKLTLFAKAY